MKNRDYAKCKHIQNLFEAYLHADLNSELEKEVEEHVNQCAICKNKLEIERMKLFGFNENRNTKKFFKRIKINFIRNVVVITVLTLFIITTFLFIIAPTFLSLTLENRLEPIQQLLMNKVQFTIPCANIRSVNTHLDLISLQADAEYKINIIGENSFIGETNYKISNWRSKSKLNTSTNSDLLYWYERNSNENSEEITKTWEKLDQIKVGTVTQFACYFKKPVSITQAEKILKEIDAKKEYSWFAIDLGKIQTENVWGFPIKIKKVMPKDDDIYHKSTQDEHMILNASKNFKNQINEMERYSKYLKDKNFSNEIMKVNKYISENGIKLNGFITVMPTRNYSILKNNSNIGNIDILKVEFDY